MFKKRILSTMVIAVLLTLSFGSQALAESGSRVFTNEQVTPFKITYPGGGTWDSGTRVEGAQKHVWSHYHHPENYHSATAKIGSKTDKKYANAGKWAKADVYGDKKDTGYTWWDNDAR